MYVQEPGFSAFLNIACEPSIKIASKSVVRVKQNTTKENVEQTKTLTCQTATQPFVDVSVCRAAQTGVCVFQQRCVFTPYVLHDL